MKIRAVLALLLAAFLLAGAPCSSLAEGDSLLPVFPADEPEAAGELPPRLLPEAPDAVDLIPDLPPAAAAAPVMPTLSGGTDYAAEDADLSGLPLLETDVSAPAEGCHILGLRGRYIADAQAALDAINQIRWEACQEGVDNPANEGTPLTPSDYRPIRWSSGLEYAARIRAAESAITRGHARTSGRSIWLQGPDGSRSSGEVIAWNWTQSPVEGIWQWYDEKADWVEKTGAVTGHYTQMIDPTHTYVGLGTFYTNRAYYPNTTVGRFSRATSLDETPMAFTGECVQKLEVLDEALDGGLLQGTLSGVSGDTSALALLVYAAGCPMNVLESVSWSSGSEDVARVDASGRVSALTCGTAAITACSASGFSATADFTVAHLGMQLPAVAATCTATGLSAGEQCAVCGEILIPQEVLPALGHSPSTLPAVSPTCTAAGLTEGRQCAVCGEILTPQETVPATGHRYGAWHTTRAATVYEAGTREHSCAVCGAAQSDALPALTPKLKLKKTSLKLAKTKSATVKVTLAAGDTLTARSSDKAIVKASAAGNKLRLTAKKKAGTADVTVTTATGLTAVLRVTVSKAKTTKLSCKALSVKKGKKATLKVKVTPAWSDDALTFKSADKKIATVTKAGVVKGKKKGKTTITVTSGKKKIKVKVTVK